MPERPIATVRPILNVAPGGAIVLVATAFFFLAWMFSPSYDVLGRHVRRSLVAGARGAS